MVGRKVRPEGSSCAGRKRHNTTGGVLGLPSTLLMCTSPHQTNSLDYGCLSHAAVSDMLIMIGAFWHGDAIRSSCEISHDLESCSHHRGALLRACIGPRYKHTGVPGHSVRASTSYVVRSCSYVPRVTPRAASHGDRDRPAVHACVASCVAVPEMNRHWTHTLQLGSATDVNQFVIRLGLQVGIALRGQHATAAPVTRGCIQFEEHVYICFRQAAS